MTAVKRSLALPALTVATAGLGACYGRRPGVVGIIEGFVRRVMDVTCLDLSPAAMQVRRERASRERARANRSFLQFLLILVSILAAFLALWICR